MTPAELLSTPEGREALRFALGHYAHDIDFARRLAASEDHPTNPDMRERWLATCMVLDPATLAELIAAAFALNGHRPLVWPGRIDHNPPDTIVIRYVLIGEDSGGMLTLPEARRKLARLLALQSDAGAEAALKALEAP